MPSDASADAADPVLGRDLSTDPRSSNNGNSTTKAWTGPVTASASQAQTQQPGSSIWSPGDMSHSPSSPAMTGFPNPPQSSRSSGKKGSAKKGAKVKLEDFLSNSSLAGCSPSAHSSMPQIHPVGSHPSSSQLPQGLNQFPVEELHQHASANNPSSNGGTQPLQNELGNTSLPLLAGHGSGRPYMQQAGTPQSMTPRHSRAAWAREALDKMSPGGSAGPAVRHSAGLQTDAMGLNRSGCVAPEPPVGGLRSRKLGLEELYISHCPQVHLNVPTTAPSALSQIVESSCFIRRYSIVLADVSR